MLARFRAFRDKFGAFWSISAEFDPFGSLFGVFWGVSDEDWPDFGGFCVGLGGLMGQDWGLRGLFGNPPQGADASGSHFDEAISRASALIVSSLALRARSSTALASSTAALSASSALRFFTIRHR